jgi:spore maturation protein CgeB
MKELSEKVLTMIHHPDQRKKMGLEGEKFMKATYDYSKIVKNMERDLGLLE